MNRLMPVGALLVFVGCGAERGSSQQPAALPVQTVLTPDGGSAGDAGSSSEQFGYPVWERADIQPNSPRAQQTYGLEAFRGHTLVVMLFEGYCPYCQSNAKVAQQLQTTLRSEHRDVELVVLSDAAASEYIGKVEMRIFRDGEAGRPAWNAMRPNAYKHDTYVFSPNGKRTYFWEGSYTGDAPRWTEQVGAAVRAVAPVQP